MKAAESTSMLKMTKIRPRWATIVGLIARSVRTHRHRRRAPARGDRTAALAHVRLELRPEVLHRRQRGRRRRVAERTQRFANDVVADAREQVDVAHLALARLDLRQD